MFSGVRHFFTDKKVDTCPACNSIRLESMPMSSNECYTLKSDAKHGVTLAFKPIH